MKGSLLLTTLGRCRRRGLCTVIRGTLAKVVGGWLCIFTCLERSGVGGLYRCRRGVIYLDIVLQGMVATFSEPLKLAFVKYLSFPLCTPLVGNREQYCYPCVVSNLRSEPYRAGATRSRVFHLLPTFVASYYNSIIYVNMHISFFLTLLSQPPLPPPTTPTNRFPPFAVTPINPPPQPLSPSVPSPALPLTYRVISGTRK